MPSARVLRRGVLPAVIAGVVAVAGPAAASLAQAGPAVASGVFRNWAQFRFDAQHTGVNPVANGLTAATVHGLVRKWSFGTVNADFVRSSPAVLGGMVFCGADDGYLYALNAASGKVKWRFFVSPKGVFSSPAVAGGIVYVGSPASKPGFLALDAGTGAIRWTVNTGAAITSSPSVEALAAGTGKRLWRYRTGLGVYSSPAVADGVVYVGSDIGKIYAFALKRYGSRIAADM